MMKARDCEELASIPGGSKYLFSGTIGNMRKLSLLSGDPYAIYNKISNGERSPVELTNVIACTMTYKDGVHVNELDLDKEVDDFIDAAGLDDCAQFAVMLIEHSLLGSVKKKSVERGRNIRRLKTKYLPSTFTRSWKLGLLLGAISITLITLACTNLK